MSAPSSPTTIVRTGHDSSSIKLADGTSPTPLEHVVKFDQHDFAVTDLTQDGREVQVIQGRGKLRSIRPGALIFPKVSFSAQVAQLSESSAGTPMDWLYKKAPYASRVSTFTSHSDKDHSDVTFTLEQGGTDETFLMEDVHFETFGFAEGDDGDKFTFSGTVYGDVYIDGVKVFTAPRAS